MSAPLSQVALSIAAIVMNGLWESALIVATVWLGLRFAPELGAATRYAIWFGTVIAIVAAPICTVLAPSHDFADALAFMPVRAAASDPDQGRVASTHEYVTTFRRLRTSAGAANLNVSQIDDLKGLSNPKAVWNRTIAIHQNAALAMTILWISFALARMLQLARDCGRLAAIRRHATPWSTTEDIPILISDRVSVPLAVGFIQRAIILPTRLVEGIASADLEAIVVHELAHLRRYDVWTNLLARISEAIGAINPATWFAMRQLSIEREIACDDWVVARTGSGTAFARTLAMLAHVAPARAPIAVPSALGSRHAIVERIERLLDARPRRLTYSRPVLCGALALLALVAILMQTLAPALAYETNANTLPRADAPASPSTATTTTTTATASCPVPNRGIRLMYLPFMKPSDAGTRPMNVELKDGFAFLSDSGEPLNATFELTVDATGKVSRVNVISTPNIRGMRTRLARLIAAGTYAPAVRNCAPFTATVRMSMHIRPPEGNSVTVITPIYAAGWSARYGSSCKVPTVTHARFRAGFDAPKTYTAMLPAFPDSGKSISVDTSYTTTIRVSVNGTAPTGAVITQRSGRWDFDDSALVAASKATYPLTATTCKPLPAAYLWQTTFAYQTLP